MSRRPVGALGVASLAVALSLGGCGFAASTPRATPTPAPLPSISGTIALTASQVEAALRTVGIGLIRPQVEYRPAESPALIEAPRGIYQAVLPDDPGAGFIVIYELADAPTAFASGQDLAAYLASGPGRVQYPLGARHVLRQVGATLVFFSWSAQTSDPGAEVAAALESLGQAIPIPR